MGLNVLMGGEECFRRVKCVYFKSKLVELLEATVLKGGLQCRGMHLAPLSVLRAQSWKVIMLLDKFLDKCEQDTWVC